MSSDDEDLDSMSEEEEAPQKARKQRKKKAKKDPNKPKRNMSAFFLYSNANRDRVKEENPDAKFGDIVSVSSIFFYPLPITRPFVVYAPFGIFFGIGRSCLSVAGAFPARTVVGSARLARLSS
jgi:hypothetical protein